MGLVLAAMLAGLLLAAFRATDRGLRRWLLAAAALNALALGDMALHRPRLLLRLLPTDRAGPEPAWRR